MSEPSQRVYVYISGPYTHGDTARNVARAMEMWHRLHRLGYTPICPHLSHFLDRFASEHLQPTRHIAYDQWLTYGTDLLLMCDVNVRMPGYSPGADHEAVIADIEAIPTIFLVSDDDLSELAERFPPPKGRG